MSDGYEGIKEREYELKAPDKLAEVAAKAKKVELPREGRGVQSAAKKEIAPPTHYAIADDWEIVHLADGKRIYVFTLDCIEIKYFWETLARNSKHYDVLQNLHNVLTADDINKRIALLKALLPDRGETHRCAVYVLVRSDFEHIKAMQAQFAQGEWRKVALKPGEFSADLLDSCVEKYQGDDDPAPTVLIARDLDSDGAADGLLDPLIAVTPPHPVETAYLEEIFSLNHVPDAPLPPGDGRSGVGPLPVPVILEDGFTFPGPDGFWQGSGDLLDMRPIDDEGIEPLFEKGVAYNRDTRTRYDVVIVEDPYVEGDEDPPAFLLRSEQASFAVYLRDEQLVAVPHHPAEESVITETDVVVTTADNVIRSPAKTARYRKKDLRPVKRLDFSIYEDETGVGGAGAKAEADDSKPLEKKVDSDEEDVGAPRGKGAKSDVGQKERALKGKSQKKERKKRPALRTITNLEGGREFKHSYNGIHVSPTKPKRGDVF